MSVREVRRELAGNLDQDKMTLNSNCAHACMRRDEGAIAGFRAPQLTAYDDCSFGSQFCLDLTNLSDQFDLARARSLMAPQGKN